MAENDTSFGTTSSPKRSGRNLRIAAGVVLVLGIFGADLVYWLGTRSVVVSNDPSLLVNEKEQARQEEILIGKQAGLIREWTADLKRPGTQAVIIVVLAALVAGGCIYFGSLADSRAEHTDESDVPQG
jgi:hypothetical protein